MKINYSFQIERSRIAHEENLKDVDKLPKKPQITKIVESNSFYKLCNLIDLKIYTDYVTHEKDLNDSILRQQWLNNDHISKVNKLML